MGELDRSAAKPSEGEPTAVLADAVNQLAMVVEDIARHTTWGGYEIESKARRRDWIERVRKERERVAHLIPE
jgi:hypothetical protein